MTDEREQRNAVFSTGQELPDPRIPTVSTSDRVKSDFGFEIPVETVPLPSSGKTYPQSSPLHMCETVDIKAMTAKEEDILTSRAYLKKGTVITELIKSCLINKSINPLDMLTGDRNALMVAIRITGYGTEYSADIECGECSVKSLQEFNLGELGIKRLLIDPVTEGTNLFEFALPYCKQIVKFKFLSGRDEEEILSTAEKQKKLGLNFEANVTTSLMHSIISVGNIEDRAKIANFVKSMPARDSLALRNYIRENEPGMDMKQDVACPSCGHSETVSIPIGISFLWPSAS